LQISTTLIDRRAKALIHGGNTGMQPSQHCLVLLHINCVFDDLITVASTPFAVLGTQKQLRIFDSKLQIADSKLEFCVAMLEICVADIDISDSWPVFATYYEEAPFAEARVLGGDLRNFVGIDRRPGPASL
jgi:hypothetical protein